MSLPTPKYEFFSRLARMVNSGQSRSIVISGNINDLFFDGTQYVPIIQFLAGKTRVDGLIQIIYELNGPVRMNEDDKTKLREAWAAWKSGVDVGSLPIKEINKDERSNIDLRRKEFDQYLRDSIGNATQALEFMRQLCICSRAALKEKLLIFIEAADMLLPAGDGDLSKLNDTQARRVAIVTDWFGAPDFFSGKDTVCLIAESRSLIHPRAARLPQVQCIDIPSPDVDTRKHYIHWQRNQPTTAAIPVAELPADAEKSTDTAPELNELAESTAGLSIHALRQLLLQAVYERTAVSRKDVVAQVEQFIQTQLGEDVVEFSKPSHRMTDVIGFANLKKFLNEYMIPRLRMTDDRALPGAAVAGPIGGGKTFIFEAVAAELDIPVLVLKGIRSQWFGQTDVIFERLKRVLEALGKVLIFVDEADTQFGGVGQDAHETERRLTGKIQAMMADVRLRGKVIWLLMTARIHLLSPDIRRPGRVGDLIIPILDATGQDRMDFIQWMIKPAGEFSSGLAEWLDQEGLPHDFSAAGFSALRSQIRATPPKSAEELKATIADFIQPAIGPTRRYQTLQALVNCTRRSLLPDPSVTDEQRAKWEEEIRFLEAQGIR